MVSLGVVYSFWVCYSQQALWTSTKPHVKIPRSRQTSMCGSAICWDIGAITSLVSCDAVDTEDVPLQGMSTVHTTVTIGTYLLITY
jgi:hypothetical protein